MAYIEPNSTIRLIKGCPLDPTQDHTILWEIPATQATYFTSVLSGYTFLKNSYQRVESGKLRVASAPENLYLCNYLAFQNTAYGSKWFYAFVTGVDYVNNNTTEITYEIDPMQTYMFDYDLEESFVEREHSATDEIGDNIVPENLETGEYISSTVTEPAALAPGDNRWIIALYSTVDDQHQPVNGVFQYDIASGTAVVTYPNTAQGVVDMQTWLTTGMPITAANPIVCGIICPALLTSSYDLVQDDPRPVTIPKKTTLLRSDGTQVKNKKCLTYPYNFLYVTNYQGKSAIYRYEFFKFSTTDAKFYMFGKLCPSPSIYLTPYGYKLLDETAYVPTGEYNPDEAIELTGFPQASWDVDSFKAWIAQNASNVTLAGVSATMGAVQGAAVGGAAGAAAGAVGGAGALINTAISGLIASAMPPQARGSMAGTASFTSRRMTFGFYTKHITPEFATIIDDYFTCYGYACNKVKVPNLRARPYWNYVKTIGCNIRPNVTNGGLPASAMADICRIYDKGITFWRDPSIIGDYSTRSNAPASQQGGGS